MQINLEDTQAPVRDAASIVMVRDASAGLEVFLLKRHGLSDVLGGAYVFPGGKVDRSDFDDDWLALIDRPADVLLQALQEDGLDGAKAAAIHVAALREAFEEAGVLYAQGAGEREARQAAQLLREGRGFDEVLAMMQLRLETARLQPWSRWVTPAVGGVMRKRFDTRFFLARVPDAQEPVHDDHEAVASCWLAPRAALEQYWARTIELAPPQIMSLVHLARHTTVESALQEARLRTPPLVHPEPFEADGVRHVCYPGDALHSVPTRALPGPTRLAYRDKRFEPAGGFDALFTDGA